MSDLRTRLGVLGRSAGVKLGLLVSCYQVLKATRNVYRVPYPDVYVRMLSIFGFAELDLIDLSPVECMGYDFHDTLIIRTATPLGLVALFLLLRYVLGEVGGACTAWSGRCARAAMLVVFLVYPGITTKTFAFFQCQKFDDGSEFLVADYSIDCNGDAHKAMLGYAVTMVLIWPVGVPIVYAALLYHNRKVLLRLRRMAVHRVHANAMAMTSLKPASASSTTSSTGGAAADSTGPSAAELSEVADELPPYVLSLSEAYAHEHFYFEVVDMLRKVVLVGFLIFIPPGSPEQLLVGLLVAVIAIMITIRALPMRSGQDNLLIILCHFEVLIAMISALVLNDDFTADDSGTGGTNAMGVILCFCALVPAAVTIVLLVLQACKLANGNEEGSRSGRRDSFGLEDAAELSAKFAAAVASVKPKPTSKEEAAVSATRL